MMRNLCIFEKSIKMKSGLISGLALVMALASCRKDVDRPAPGGAAFKNVYCTLSGCDTSDVFVSSESATRDEYVYGWASRGDAYVAVTLAGNVASFYRGDTLRLYGNVQAPATATIRLDSDIIAVVNITPDGNDGPSFSWIVNW